VLQYNLLHDTAHYMSTQTVISAARHSKTANLAPCPTGELMAWSYAIVRLFWKVP